MCVGLLRRSHDEFIQRSSYLEEPGVRFDQGQQGYNLFLVRIQQYETAVAVEPNNYQLWRTFIVFLTNSEYANSQYICQILEQVLHNVPTNHEKRTWFSYVRLWMFYAAHAESMGNYEQTRRAYETCLNMIPHNLIVTSRTLRRAYSQFEFDHQNFEKARFIMNRAIEACPSKTVFEDYLMIEMGLSTDHQKCIYLVKKILEYDPKDVHAWVKYGCLEKKHGSLDIAFKVISHIDDLFVIEGCTADNAQEKLDLDLLLSWAQIVPKCFLRKQLSD